MLTTLRFISYGMHIFLDLFFYFFHQVFHIYGLNSARNTQRVMREEKKKEKREENARVLSFKILGEGRRNPYSYNCGVCDNVLTFNKVH